MSIFRAYDIRGVYGKDLTDKIAEDIGKAFGSTFKGRCAVGFDVRLSSPALAKALAKGLMSAGINVVDVGLVPTPLLYFAIHHLKLDAGIMVTGSHNPPEYNGFKMWRGATTLSGEEIKELETIIQKGKFREGKGKTEDKSIVHDYVSYVKQRIKLEKKLKIVVDSANGNAGAIAPKIMRDLGCEVIELYSQPDGKFPNHPADPTVDENLKDLINAVNKEKADIGISYDGDADRAGFVSDKSEIVRGDQALILFSREILKKNAGAKIICEVKCSQSVLEDVTAHGGKTIMYRTGHSFIKNKLKEEKALLAGEMSGHFYFADNYPGYDDGIYASLRMIQILSHSNKKMSELIQTIPKYHSTPEIRVDCPDDRKFQIVEEVSKALQKKGLNVLTIDGARIQYPDGWGLIRASNTTPILVLRFEAKTQKRLEEIKKIILDELEKHLKINLST